MKAKNINMHVKKGDKVKVITGGDKGKEGVITQTIPSLSKIVVENVNIKKVHKKATKQNQKGSIVEVAMPIHSSNVVKVK